MWVWVVASPHGLVLAYPFVLQGDRMAEAGVGASPDQGATMVYTSLPALDDIRKSVVEGSWAFRFPDRFARFWSRLSCDFGCWSWTGSLTSDGYGQFAVEGRSMRAHRLSWLAFVGPLERPGEPGLVLDHLCRNRACVCPAHLELVTPQVNVRRGRSCYDSQLLCKRGHLMTAANSYWSKGKRGKRTVRQCRACRRLGRRRRSQES